MIDQIRWIWGKPPSTAQAVAGICSHTSIGLLLLNWPLASPTTQHHEVAHELEQWEAHWG